MMIDFKDLIQAFLLLNYCFQTHFLVSIVIVVRDIGFCVVVVVIGFGNAIIGLNDSLVYGYIICWLALVITGFFEKVDQIGMNSLVHGYKDLI